MTYGGTATSVFHLHQKYLTSRTYCAMRFLQKSHNVRHLASIGTQTQTSHKNKLLLNERMPDNLLDNTTWRRQHYQTITNGDGITALNQNCDNLLVNKPKYSFLKELGIEQHNNGVFNGKWIGSGAVRSHICNFYKF